ncbi:MAG: hypothetical protein J7647_12610 [Cyanobacteria bacterium SBLK]|nr:hypothetical protein [Cyanobacteria bacterium SBLK]
MRSLQQAHLAYVKADGEHLETRLRENRLHERKIAREISLLEGDILRLIEGTDEKE